MRIIKEGCKPKIEVEETCERCGCVFRYTKGDLEYDQRNDESWVTCPCCGKAIVVEPLNEWWTPKQSKETKLQ